jgi:DNA primase
MTKPLCESTRTVIAPGVTADVDAVSLLTRRICWVSGRISAQDIAEVRDRVRIDEVISEHVTLRSAGAGSLKGLCPFHEERSPSFHVTPSKGLYYCFGCGEGGDAIDFLMAMDHLSFTEAVEKLAGRVGVALRYEGGGPAAGPDIGQRNRLLAVNAAADDYFQAALRGNDAARGREFLQQRGFADDSWGDFGIGYAPRGGLVAHLRKAGFDQRAIVESGVAGSGDDRVYDRFRDRLIWPIRDVSGEVVGFGARRLSDEAGPKYLNTPETPVYHKSQVLYGLYEARKQIAREQRVVVVEGYTDVMACRLAGIPTAVATCGTAFGTGHVKVLRRLLLDDANGQVVFTFDGDEPGRKAALRAYEEDQQFASQTFVAIARDGLDPCDLRLQYGDQAVRDLVESRVPLFEFVLRSALADLDLRTAEGRAVGLRAVSPIIASLKDPTLRPEYARQVGGWLGVDGQQVMAEVRRIPRSGGDSRTRAPARTRAAAPSTNDRDLEHQALQVILQVPELVTEWLPSVDGSTFTDEQCRGVFAAIQRASSADSQGAAGIRAIVDACADDDERTRVRALTAKPLPADPVTPAYAIGIVSHLLHRAAGRRAADLRAALGEPGVADDAARSTALLSDLMAIEDYRRMLRDYWAKED